MIYKQRAIKIRMIIKIHVVHLTVKTKMSYVSYLSKVGVVMTFFFFFSSLGHYAVQIVKHL